jgi:hypothetical protein
MGKTEGPEGPEGPEVPEAVARAARIRLRSSAIIVVD